MGIVEVEGRQQGEVAKREALLLTTNEVSYSAYAAASMYVYGTNQQVVFLLRKTVHYEYLDSFNKHVY